MISTGMNPIDIKILTTWVFLMINKIIDNSLRLFKDIIFNPNEMFGKLEKAGYDYSVYFLFGISGLITFFKSFSVKTYNINYFTNEHLNKAMSFFNAPQIKWLLTFLSFILFIFLIKTFCLFLLKKCKRKGLIVCTISISSAGILLQITFYTVQHFLPQTFVYVLSYIAFIWIICLTILAIKNSQNTSYMKSIMIYILSSLPVFLVIGLTGLAPFLLWLVSPTAL